MGKVPISIEDLVKECIFLNIREKRHTKIHFCSEKEEDAAERHPWPNDYVSIEWQASRQ